MNSSYDKSFNVLSKYEQNLYQVKSLINKAINDFETYSFQVATQFNKERKEIKKNKNIQEKQATQLWEKLTNTQKIKLVKHDLPLFDKLFKHINIATNGVTGEGIIFIYFSFNDNHINFEREYNIDKVKEILKL